MANVQITQLPAAGTLTGTEAVPIVQNGVTVQTTTGAITSGPSLTQTFITVNNEPSLANSRFFSVGSGLTLTDNGAQSNIVIGLTGAISTLNALGEGLIAKTGTSTLASREIDAGTVGLSVADGNGIGGNPTISLTGLPLTLAQLTGSGIVTYSGSTINPRTITGTANQISVANGTGVNGDPTIAMVANPIIPGSGAITIPIGTIGQRPLGQDGQIRYNTQTSVYEAYGSGGWNELAVVGNHVDSFSAGATGLTPSSPQLGNIVLGGILNVPSGGTGVATLTGYVKGNGASVMTASATIPSSDITGLGTMANENSNSVSITGGSLTGVTVTTGSINDTPIGATTPSSGAFTTLTSNGDAVVTASSTTTLTNKTINGSTNTLTNIANGSLVNSSITINGTSIALGSSGTVTASLANALTIGTGLSGTTYNGSTPVTIAIDSTVATLTGTQTLTNKTLTTPVIASISNTGTVTLPTATTTLIGRDTTDTLTNKSISGSTNTLSNIANASLTNSSVTINGSAISLGGSTTITAVNPSALTIGTGLTGTSYSGATAVTIAIDTGTVATLNGTQTLTNKTINASSNTLSNIGNASLTNSSVTIGSTSVSLGGTASTIGGLTLTAPTISSITNGGTVTVPSGTDTLVARTTTDTLTNKTINASLNTISNIANSSLTNSSITIGTTPVSLGGTTLTPAGLTSVTVTQDPTQDLQLATKQYVDAQFSNVNYHEAVEYASTVSYTVTYNNGSSGVGATLTNAGAQAALVVDGITMTATDVTNQARILIKNQASGAQNGVYVLTNQGSGSSNWSMIRSTDMDTSGTGSDTVSPGDTFYVTSGVSQATTSWVQTTKLPIVIGTTPLVFTQVGGPAGGYTFGTGLQLIGSTISLTDTTVTAGAYTLSNFTVDAQGRLTAASSSATTGSGNVVLSTSPTLVTPALGTPTSGTLTSCTGLPISTGVSGLGANVATFLGTPTSANLASAVSDETGSGSLVFATSPTLVTPALGTPSSGTLTSCTGLPLSTGVTGTLPIANGGTGQTTASTAFNALSPITTAGDLIFGDGANSATRLAIGANGYVLTSNGSTASWQATSSGVTSFSAGTTGFTPSTATSGAVTLAGTLATSNGGTGLTSFTTNGAVYATSTSALTTGTLPVTSGGTGVTTLTGVVYGNGSSPFTAATGSEIATAIGATAVTNATNASNVAITTGSATTNYLAFVTATTGNLPVLTDTDLTYNATTNALTSGISGGTF
jgi:hypothetical protein